MSFATPDGPVFPYRNKHHNLFHSGQVAVTGSKTVNLGLNHGNFHATASFAEEPGDADDVGRLSVVNNNDGTFTITVKDLVLSEGAPNTVGWVDSAAPYNIQFLAIESDSTS